MNLLESVAIVILLIMAIMGFRAGLLIGSSLLFTIGGTLLIMQGVHVGLNRTSLAGFIIAMGMLVDNAIVVTDNAQNAMLRGVPRVSGPDRGGDRAPMGPVRRDLSPSFRSYRSIWRRRPWPRSSSRCSSCSPSR